MWQYWNIEILSGKDFKQKILGYWDIVIQWYGDMMIRWYWDSRIVRYGDTTDILKNWGIEELIFWVTEIMNNWSIEVF